MSKQNVHEVEDGLVSEVRPDCRCRCRLVVIAMPGLGKTTFAREHNRSWLMQPPWTVGDVDFGEWRKSHGLPCLGNVSTDQGLMYAKFVQESIIPAMKKYDVILCNEPGVIPYLPTDVPVVTAVPDSFFVKEWKNNLLTRTADQISRGSDDSDAAQDFLVRVATEAEDWVRSPSWRAPMAMQLKFRSYEDWGILYSLMELMSNGN